MHVLAHFEHGFHLVAAITRRILKIARDVAARTKASPGPGQHHDAHVVIIARIGERGQYFVHHHFGVGIQLRRTIECNRGYVFVFDVNDFAKFHVLPPDGLLRLCSAA